MGSFATLEKGDAPVMRTILLRGTPVLALLAGALWLGESPGRAADAGPDPKEVKAVVDKGAAFLRSTQNPDGNWSKERTGPGCTALVVAALLRNGYTADDPTVA